MKLRLGVINNRWSRLTVGIGLAVSALLAWQLDKSNEQRVQEVVAEAAIQANLEVKNRLERYLYGLSGARGAVLTAGEYGISRDQFHRYSLTRDLNREFPGARGFGFIRRVPRFMTESFTEMAQADSQPDFQIKELAAHDGERYVIQYIEPLKGNESAIGLDIASESNRREAALAAIRSGEARLTGPITLVQASGQPLQSILMLMPIYRAGIIPTTVAEREQSGFGWSHAPLLLDEVLSTLRLDADVLHLELFDVTDPGNGIRFYSNSPESDAIPSAHIETIQFEVYGRRWESQFSVYPSFVQDLQQNSPLKLFLLGSVISLLVASLIGSAHLSRRRRQQMLDEQAKLAAIVESSADGIIGKTLDGVITSWNRGAEQLFGYPAGVALGQGIADLVVPDDRLQEEADILARVRNGEHISHFDTIRQRQDGHRFHVSVTVSPVRNSRGQVIGASKTVRDITSQKEAEARVLELNSNLEAQVTQRTSELAELNMLFGNVLDAASEVAIVATGTDGVISLFNTGAKRLLGYRADEMVGQHTPGHFHLANEMAARGAELSQEIGRAVTGFEVFTFRPKQEGAEVREWSYQCKDGSIVPVMLVVTAMRDNSGQITGYLGVATDITEQRRHSSELTAARDQLLMAADVAELGIWTWTLADSSLDWNDKMFELYGYPVSLRDQKMSYEHWHARLHPDDAEYAVSCMDAIMKGTAAYDPVFRLLLPDGSIRFLQAGAQIERDDLGHVIRVTGINFDITKQRELETGLRQAKAEADEASAAKSTFLANMSHEIRTPMNAVLGMLQLVQQTALNQRQLDYVVKAYTAARSLLGLLNDILDYSKIEAGKLQLEQQPFELEDVMEDLAVVLSGNLGTKPVELMFDLAPSLPSHLIGDRLRLQQILINLAGNAIKFTEYGEVVVSVTEVSRNASSVRLCIAVTDTGIGIAEDKIDHILEAFSQAEASTARRFGGTGLGLVISKRLLALMNGQLQVSSTPGVGSRFWFEITLALTDTSIESAPDELAEPLLRILVVDDHPVSAEILARAAGLQGWQVNIANSGQAAVTEVERAQDYDLVLMDWAMPGMNGLEAAGQIRDLNLAQPPSIIMITAYGREQLAEAQQNLNPPFVDFLTKPVTTRQLVNTVRRSLSGEYLDPEHKLLPADSLLRLEGLRLLVVEDNALNRQIAAELLAGEGALVELAEGGLEGVSKVIAAPTAFDMVLMDMQMPDIDGLEATRRIRADDRCQPLPILAMTANVTQADQQACLAAGMNAHIGKPVDIEQLVAVILKFLHRTDESPTPAQASDECAVTQPTHTDRVESASIALVEDKETILRRFGGNERLYRQMLLGLAENARELFVELAARLDEQDIEAACAVLHTFKGVAGTMGAARFAARMSELERQLKGMSIDDAISLLDETNRLALNDLLAQSRAELLQAVPEPVATVESTATGASADETRAHLEQLLILLDAGNLDAIDCFEQIPTAVIDALSTRREELANEVQNLNFTAASSMVRVLLETL